MSQLNRTKWNRRLRIGVTSDLEIEGNKGITITDGVIYTGGSNIGVSFIINANTLVGNCLAKGATLLSVSELGLRVGDKTHIAINSNGTWWKNGRIQGSSINKDWSVAGNILVGQNNNPNFTLSHVVFFDEILTDKQARFIFVAGGIMPSNLHDGIISHYPLETVYDDGANNVTPDCVEQYNYEKVTPLTANHGVLVNYTDDELGLIYQSDQVAIRDFYDKSIAKHNGIYMPSLSGLRALDRAQFIDVPIVAYGRFCWDKVVGVYRTLYSEGRYGLRIGFFQPLNEITVYDGNYIAGVDDNPIPERTIKIPFPLLPLREIHFIVAWNWANSFLYIQQGNENYTYILNPTPVTWRNSTSANRDIGVFDQQNTATAVGLPILATQLRLWYGTAATTANIADILNGSFATTPSNEWRLNELDNAGNIPVSMPDIYGTRDVNIFSNCIEGINYESLIPPRKKALTFNGTSQYLRVPNFGPTKERGYTIIQNVKEISVPATSEDRRYFGKSDSSSARIEFAAPDSIEQIRVNYPAVMTKSYSYDNRKQSNLYAATIIDGHTRLFINGHLVNEAKGVSIVISDMSLIANDLVVGCQRVSEVIRTATNIYCGYFIIFKGFLSQAEILAVINNTLISNPRVEIQNKYSLELFIDFNNPFDDGGTLKFPDLSPNNHEVIAEGYTDLADLQTSLVDINSLR